MKVLAIDLGTRMGWAIGTGTGTTAQFGTVDFKLRANESRGARFLKFQTWLETTLERERIDIIAFEDVRAHRGVLAAHIYGGFQAILFSLSERFQIPCKGLAVTTIKKSLTGTGRATKQQMIEAAKARGFAVGEDHDAADAIGVLVTARQRLIPDQDGFITLPEYLQ